MLRRIINGPLASRNWWQCTSDPNLEFIKFISWQIRLQKKTESYLSGFVFGQTYKHLYRGYWNEARKERILEWVSEQSYTDGKCCMSFYILGIWGGCWEELGRLWEEASVGSWKEGWSELTEKGENGAGRAGVGSRMDVYDRICQTGSLSLGCEIVLVSEYDQPFFNKRKKVRQCQSESHVIMIGLLFLM